MECSFSLYDEKLVYTRYLADDLCDFLWFQKFRNALDDIPVTSHAKSLMLETCRKRYSKDVKKLKDIDEFEKNYTVDNAINWYTRASFVFEAINTALRKNNMGDLYIFRWCIIDLCHCLRDKWEKERSSFTAPLNVYRGMKMLQSDFQKLKSYGVGALIAESGFLSTTIDLAVAEMFAGYGTLPLDSDEVSVILDVTIADTQNPEGPIFANLAPLSAIPDEKEILFDMSTPFHIKNIEYNETQRTSTVKLVPISRRAIVDNIKRKFGRSDSEQKQLYATINKQLMEWYGFLMLDAVNSFMSKSFDSFSEIESESKDESHSQQAVSFFGKSIKHVAKEVQKSHKEIATATAVTLRMRNVAENQLGTRETIRHRLNRYGLILRRWPSTHIFKLTSNQPRQNNINF